MKALVEELLSIPGVAIYNQMSPTRRSIVVLAGKDDERRGRILKVLVKHHGLVVEVGGKLEEPIIDYRVGDKIEEPFVDHLDSLHKSLNCLAYQGKAGNIDRVILLDDLAVGQGKQEDWNRIKSIFTITVKRGKESVKKAMESEYYAENGCLVFKPTPEYPIFWELPPPTMEQTLRSQAQPSASASA